MATNEPHNCPECGQFGTHTFACSRRPAGELHELMQIPPTCRQAPVRGQKWAGIILLVIGEVVGLGLAALFIYGRIERDLVLAFGGGLVISILSLFIGQWVAKTYKHDPLWYFLVTGVIPGMFLLAGWRKILGQDKK